MELTFEEFAVARLPSILRYATALTGSPQLAEDIVQDVLLRAHGRWRRIGQVDRPDLYVKRMVLNEYLGWRRRRSSRDIAMPADLVDGLAVPVPDHAHAQGERDALRRVLARLPRRQRAVLVLRYFEGMPDEDIAAALGCSTGTVRSHVSHAMASLRGALGPRRADAQAVMSSYQRHEEEPA
jgi:RNA polymerase sigma-70 factor (sigma-E family)